ncbi:phosphoglycerate kinase [Enterobacteriaceae endosymbiont of Plateumaris consimilis]|uniref:phosphoglycerate kinase n=1 Tax=Enterobacteriaceae endosymbiont of Plateumaris consimilis TaxID=2675794 RepID=UPI001449B27C|nr:phosphoglycerate kinase [Enterobacteriaceae endosymbiont of Plateumaris consimilis]QJC28545.1 phosphoglycerate kinase [Enterobacteriaceae endosymbiont of Plateumaris consimilis]
MSILSILDINITNKILLIRSDLNVPINNKGNIISDIRIRLSLPTIKYAINKGAKVIIASHLGRPLEGSYNRIFSLKNISKYLENILNYKVYLQKDFLNKLSFKKNEIIMLENVRFNIGEKKNDRTLSKKYATLCDIFVMDAFATAHRKHSSTYGIIKYAKKSCAGLLLINELNSLNKIFKNPKHPIISIVGGSKISTKFNVLNKLAKLSNKIIVGGGIANTFLAINNNVGQSLYEPNALNLAKKLQKKHNNFIIPIDCKVGTSFSNDTLVKTKKINNILSNEIIMDIGENTIKIIIDILNKAKTILWNGPLGVFEFANFNQGTKSIAYTIANSNSFSIAGGGDTLAAIELFNLFNKISYISTGGGSFLNFIEGKKLPSVFMLEKYYSMNTI